jgi:restriction system protein
MSGTDDTVVWGIHAGRTGDADEQFLKGSCIALGWAGDLSALKPRQVAGSLASDG